jgi:uncharacterized Zn finger protein (UPF0148 family)
MTNYKCDQCGEPLEPFDDEGMLVIPACDACVKTAENENIESNREGGDFE